MDVFHNILLTNKDLILKKKLIPQEGINCLRTLDSFVWAKLGRLNED